MINRKHFHEVISHLTIPEGCEFVFVELFVTEDKHYPGIKNISIEAINQNVWFNIRYPDVAKIFDCEKKPLKMRALCNYLMENGNQLDHRALDFAEALRNRSNDFLLNRQTKTKHIRITVDTFQLEEKMIALLEHIEKLAEENQFIIRSLADFY